MWVVSVCTLIVFTSRVFQSRVLHDSHFSKPDFVARITIVLNVLEVLVHLSCLMLLYDFHNIVLILIHNLLYHVLHKPVIRLNLLIDNTILFEISINNSPLVIPIYLVIAIIHLVFHI